MKFKPNFSSAGNKRCKITHYSTSSTIELQFFAEKDTEAVDQIVYLEYADLDALIDVIQQIKNDNTRNIGGHICA